MEEEREEREEEEEEEEKEMNVQGMQALLARHPPDPLGTFFNVWALFGRTSRGGLRRFGLKNSRGISL